MTGSFEAGQIQILEWVATSTSLTVVLEEIVRLIERQQQGLLCSILLADTAHHRLRHGAAPSLPPEYVQALDGMSYGPATGSCGTAAHSRERVVVEDISTHPYWVNFRALAMPHGLRACWSTPIVSPQGELLGTFAVYYREPRRPTAQEEKWVAAATNLASIAIVRDWAEAALKHSETRFRLLHELGEASRAANTSHEALQAALKILGTHLRVSRCVYAEVSLDGNTFHVPFDWTDGCVSIAGTHPLNRFGRTVAEAFRHGGQPVTVKDIELELPAEDRPSFRAMGVRSLVCCSVIRDGALRALMSVHQAEPREWTANEVGLLREFVERYWSTFAQRAAEERLRKSEALLSIASRAAHLGGWSIDVRDLRLSWSDEVRAIHQVPAGTSPTVEAAVRSYAPEHQPIMRAALDACMQHGTPFDLELQIVTAQQRRVWVRAIGLAERDGTGEVIRVQGAIQDISERRMLADQLRQAQKMEAIGQLAGGIAHDFNNLLSVILSYSTYLIEELSPGNPMREEASEIKKAGERAAALTGQLLAFSRQQVLQPRVLDLQRVLGNLEKILKRMVGETISLTVHNAPELGLIRADQGQVEQVLLNLVVNARDAMPSGGSLTIDTEDVELDAAYVALHPDAVAGKYVRLTVSDTGHGMDSSVRARVFEPFFTTKEQGKGTGLGLATVFGIMKQSEGHVSVESEVGVGSSFKVYFPRVEGAVEADEVIRRRPTTTGGTETILVVEDEEPVRNVVSAILRRAGYTVQLAPNGEEARALSERFSGQIDLLLTDVVMPGISGRALADRLAITRPQMPVLFMSGYTEDSIVHHGVLDDGIAYLPKPFTPEGLLRGVRRVLDERKNATRQAVASSEPLHVLLVDDDEGVTELMERILKKSGYRVSSYTDPTQALAAFREAPTAFSVVMTDVSMHKMTGFELGRHVRELRPEMPLVVCSGHFRRDDLEQAAALKIQSLYVKTNIASDVLPVLRAELVRSGVVSS